MGCQKNNADGKNFGYCFAYHSTITKRINQHSDKFQKVLTQIDPSLANEFAMRWIREYYMSASDAHKQKKISQAQENCRNLSLPY